jgi:hypothetical protein
MVAGAAFALTLGRILLILLYWCRVNFRCIWLVVVTFYFHFLVCLSFRTCCFVCCALISACILIFVFLVLYGVCLGVCSLVYYLAFWSCNLELGVFPIRLLSTWFLVRSLQPFIVGRVLLLWCWDGSINKILSIIEKKNNLLFMF